MPALLASQSSLKEPEVGPPFPGNAAVIEGAHQRTCMHNGAALGQQWNGIIFSLQSMFLLGATAPETANFQTGVHCQVHACSLHPGKQPFSALFAPLNILKIFSLVALHMHALTLPFFSHM